MNGRNGLSGDAEDLWNRNKILRFLPEVDRRSILRQAEVVPLKAGELVFSPRGQSRVTFPLEGVVTLMTTGSPAMGVTSVGPEGFIEPVALIGKRANLRAIVHVPGIGLRMEIEGFRKSLANHRVVGPILLGYTYALLQQMAQELICLQEHTIEARCARWLLHAQNSTGSADLHLTQQSLAEILGVRRASVNEVANRLREMGGIQYHRGAIEIVDRRRLENCACQCYPAIRAVHRQYVTP